MLVVEDDPDARTIFSSMLLYLGALVTTASSAQEGLNVLRQVRADVVVCDVYLEDEDAFWLLRQAQAHQPGTPFVAVSGRDHDEQAMQQAGFSASLRKPVALETLATIVRAVTDR